MLKEECDYVTGWPLGQQAVAISRTTADKRELAFALNELGQIARFHGQYTEARVIHAEARDLYQELGDDLWAAFSIDAIAWTAMDQQSFDEAVHLHQVAQRAWPKIGPRLPGWVHFLQGRCDAARAAHHLALEAYRERGDGGGRLWVLADLGFIDLRQGDVISAGRHFCEVLQRAEQRGYRMHIARALHGVSRMAALRSEHALARSLAEAEWNLRSSFGIAVPPSERVALQRTDPESTAVAHTSLDSAVLAAFDFLTRLTQASGRSHAPGTRRSRLADSARAGGAPVAGSGQDESRDRGHARSEPENGGASHREHLLQAAGHHAPGSRQHGPSQWVVLNQRTMHTVTAAPRILDGPHAGAYRPPAVGRNGVVAAAHGLAATAGLRVLFEGGNGRRRRGRGRRGAGRGRAVHVRASAAAAASCSIYEAATRTVHALDYLGTRASRRRSDARSRASRTSTPTSARRPSRACWPAGWPPTSASVDSIARGSVPAGHRAGRAGLAGQPVGGQHVPRLRRRLRQPRPRRRCLAADGGPPRRRRGRRPAGPGPHATARSSRAAPTRSIAAISVGGWSTPSSAAGGWLTEADLASYRADAGASRSAIDYRGWQVHTLAAAVVRLPVPGVPEDARSRSDLAALEHNSADYLHLLLETIKLASADRTRYASADPATIAALLSTDYAAERRALDRSGARRAAAKASARRQQERRRCSPATRALAASTRRTSKSPTAGATWSRSPRATARAFGSGFVAGDTGIVLNNFLYWTDLDPASPNYCARAAPARDADGAVHRHPRRPAGPGHRHARAATASCRPRCRCCSTRSTSACTSRPRSRRRACAPSTARASTSRPASTRRSSPTCGRAATTCASLAPWTWAVGGGHGIASTPSGRSSTAAPTPAATARPSPSKAASACSAARIVASMSASVCAVDRNHVPRLVGRTPNSCSPCRNGASRAASQCRAYER